MPAARRLARALTDGGVPVHGVAIGAKADRATWRIDYKAEATAQQRTDGESLKSTFDPDAASEATKDAQEVRDQEIGSKVIKALALATHKRFKAQVPTDPTTARQWQDAIKAEYDAL